MINSSVREQYVLNEQVGFLFFVQRHFEWTYQSPSCCRWGVLVDHSSSFKAEVRRWKGQGGWRPHPCQCVLWEIPGKTFHTPSTLMLHNGEFRHVYTVLNLRFFHLLLVLCPQHLSYASGDLMVDASFMQTLWNMNPISSGCELAEGTNLFYKFSSTATSAV